jgi:hypothetical protein
MMNPPPLTGHAHHTDDSVTSRLRQLRPCLGGDVAENAALRARFSSREEVFWIEERHVAMLRSVARAPVEP